MHFCGKNGHTKSVCYKKNGFPSNKGGKRVCSHCGKTGHTIDTCYKKHEFPPGHKPFSANIKADDTKNDEDEQEIKFTKQQYQALMALIKPVGESVTITPKSSHISSISTNNIDSGNIVSYINMIHNEERWIVDSGATDHVTISLDNFDSYSKINDIKVNLPNGIHVKATHKGNIKLNNGITLHNVLFIPEFNYNLISLSKLIKDSQVHIAFTDSGCFI